MIQEEGGVCVCMCGNAEQIEFDINSMFTERERNAYLSKSRAERKI